MRTSSHPLLSSYISPRLHLSTHSLPSTAITHRATFLTSLRQRSQLRPSTPPSRPFPAVWFTGSNPVRTPEECGARRTNDGDGGGGPVDERTLGLGKTLRILQPRLPTLLSTANPLPADILGPDITLHLFPSTHPHLPAVRGRVPYLAALWTAPVAWGRVPLIGNVGVEVLSERMVQGGSYVSPLDDGDTASAGGEEKLVVRWRTKSKTNKKASTTHHEKEGTEDEGPLFRSSSSPSSPLSTSSSENEDSFTGLFIFTFDSVGRIHSHVIEHVEPDASGREHGLRDRNGFLSLTEWLLRRLGGTREIQPQGLAWGCCDGAGDRRGGEGR
ncbi:MAG: hypothetical protein M1817_003732 [Caeruleum heppii]|nr:MAG: hypothetical protein M1817_003732 [Caeruleum heppii]